MTTNQLYLTIMDHIKQLVGHERVTRQRVLAWLMVCLWQGRWPHASRLAHKIPGRAKQTSKGERLRRWLSNQAVRPRVWFEPLARELLLQASAHGQPVRLLVDGTRIGSRHQLLMVALAYRRRALPIAWTWVRYGRGHSSAATQGALLAYVHALVPPGTAVQLAGDSEFGAVEVLCLLDGWQWHYALRQTGKHLARSLPDGTWQRLDAFVHRPGRRAWLAQAALTRRHAYPTQLLLLWRRGEPQPWLLATNLGDPAAATRLYRRRMWIEAMFGDFKANGFDLEAARLRHFLRLSRLTLAVALLYVWLMAFASQVVKRGQRHLVDRTDRRDLSLFRIGYDTLERCFVNHEPFTLRLVPYF